MWIIFNPLYFSGWPFTSSIDNNFTVLSHNNIMTDSNCPPVHDPCGNVANGWVECGEASIASVSHQCVTSLPLGCQCIIDQQISTNSFNLFHYKFERICGNNFDVIMTVNKEVWVIFSFHLLFLICGRTDSVLVDHKQKENIERYLS